MHARPFGATGASLSEIGFGAWAIGGGFWGGTHDDAARAALRRAHELGVTFYDTAQVYGDGHSESLIGEFTRRLPERPLVATKVPPRNYEWDLDDDADLDDVFPRAWVEREVEGSLRRLRTERIDLYQLHTWSRAFNERDEWKESARRLRERGLIRWFGISAPNRRAECVLGAVETGLVDAVQIIYNVFQAEVARTVFPTLHARGLGVIVRVPLFEGALTGRFTKETRFPSGDFRGEYFGGNKLAATVERVEALKKVAAEMRPGMPLAELALRFALSHDAVSTVIPGMRSVAQVDVDTAAGDSRRLTAEELDRLAPFAWDKDFWSEESV